MPVRSLDDLAQPRAAALIDVLLESPSPPFDELGALLHDSIAKAAVPDRVHLLRLRRDLFNERPPNTECLATARRLLSADALRLLDRRVRHQTHRAGLETDAAAALESELRVARRSLARLASVPPLAEAVQLLTNPALARAAKRYAERVPPESSPPSRLRKAEDTLVSLAYRSALKPSPFGSLTTLALTVQQFPHASSRPEEGEPSCSEPKAETRRTVQLNRTVLDWMVSALAENPAHPFPVRWNNTIRRSGNLLEWYAADRAGHGALRSISLDDLPPGHADPAIGTGTNRLLELKLVETWPAVPDQGLDAAAIADSLDDADETLLADRRTFGTLAKLVGRLSTAPVAERGALLAAVEEEVHAFARRRKTTPPEGVRATVYEEVRSGRRPEPGQWTRLCHAVTELDQLNGLLAVFDPRLIERLGLQRWIAERVSAPVDVLTLFRDYAALDSATRRLIAEGAEDPRVGEVQGLRAWFSMMTEQPARHGTVSLTPAQVSEFNAEAASVVSAWPSATYLVQLCAEGIVLNDVQAGDGMFLGRFCEPGSAAATVLGKILASTAPRQADLVAVLGLNYNVHPDLAPLEVEYPGAHASRSDALTLRDLLVYRVDGRPVLISKRDGQSVALRPFNGLNPDSAPELYRFLMTFTESARFRGGLTDLYLATRTTDERAGGVETPRIRLGQVIIQRRAWHYPAAALRKVMDEAVDDLALLRAARRWRLLNDLPDHCFFRLSDPFPSSSPRRARAYKPHYLDFGNVLLLRALTRGLSAVSAEATLVLEECLPGTGAYHDQTPAAEEFAVEYRRAGQ
ncbi:hypothetical protein [Actinomadura monticuli]|uniref:Lantibiotic dehydratase n=1 Tax=Actinomadura monticuli TaxID=3097367 RepID=A0ABV4Q4M1_9ACTN